jgi:D-alanine-D-alanine ligase-like ATP-grasp enzyme
MKACEHVPILGSKYVGLYCVYCKANVAELVVSFGQLCLDRDGHRSYLAVVQNNKKQREVEEMEERKNEPALILSFRGGGTAEVSIAKVLLDFQKQQEVLEL